jgi:hypothetical protein
MRTQHILLLSFALAALLTAGLSFAGEHDDPRRLRVLTELLQREGYTQVEEIEAKLLGRYEVEALHESGRFEELSISKDGKTLLGTRAQRSGPDRNDLLPVAEIEPALDWLEQNGYSRIHSLSGEPGVIEVEASAASGQRFEIELDRQTLTVLDIERD